MLQIYRADLFSWCERKIHLSKINSWNLLTVILSTIDCKPPFAEVTKSGTTIISPNYPSNYDNSNDCQVTIRFAIDETVKIMFEEFDVENHSNCIYDYLAIHDGNCTSSPTIESKLCGNSLAGTTMQSTQNVMTIHFHTDNSQSGTGFRVYATTVKGKVLSWFSVG